MKSIQTAKINQLTKLIQEGVDSWIKAGKVLVSMLDADKNAYDAILKQCPKLSYNILATLENIGRGLILPELAIDTSAGCRRLAMLPMSVQKEYIEKRVTVVSAVSPEGRMLTNTKPVHELSMVEVDRVFTNTNVRTPEQQVKFIKEQQQHTTTVLRQQHRYEILCEGSLIKFKPGAVFELKEMETIVAEMHKTTSKYVVTGASKLKTVKHVVGLNTLERQLSKKS